MLWAQVALFIVLGVRIYDVFAQIRSLLAADNPVRWRYATVLALDAALVGVLAYFAGAFDLIF